MAQLRKYHDFPCKNRGISTNKNCYNHNIRHTCCPACPSSKNNRAGAESSGPKTLDSPQNDLAKKEIMVAGTVGQNGRVDHLSTGATLPRVESTDEIIKLFSIHPTLAFGTLHGATSSENFTATTPAAWCHYSSSQAVPDNKKRGRTSPSRFADEVFIFIFL